jgi:integrase
MDETTLQKLERSAITRALRGPQKRPAPPRRVVLSTAFVERHALPDEGKVQTIFWDKHLPGFGLRVGQDTRTWMIAYRFKGRMRWVKLGRFPALGLAAAREMARKKLAQVELGTDIAAMKQAELAADTFAMLAQRYLDTHAELKKKISSIREDRKILKRELLPAWGSRKAGDIVKRDVIALIDAIAARGAPVGAIRVLALASKIFNFAISKDLLAVNPAYRVSRPVKERPRERVLGEGEIRTLWAALDAFPAITDVYRLLLLTAQRVGEVLRMSWAEIDFDSAVWTIPADRAKNHHAHRVPLSISAIEILQRRRATADVSSIFVFPGRHGHSVRALGYASRQHGLIKRAVNFDFQVRDLRRSAGTCIAATRAGRFIVGQVLGHADRSVTSIYDKHSYDSEKRLALEKWDRRLRDIISGAPKVVALRAPSAA